ncbi:hypothetical protein FACS1894110_23910 [Spirochaetia bacterium]|nr:hypothetical protein FACS1894110_23910 [Spirochaetia bacterium]
MNSTLKERLSIVPEEELGKFLAMFKEGRMPEFNAGMTSHFRIAKEKSEKFSNHPKALGISVGGTNAKLILASMQKGSMVVHHVSAAMNPPEKIHVYDFFNKVLLGDPVFAEYLKNTPRPVVGISVPTRVLGGIPFHETKVPTIDGLMARNQAQMTDEYNLSKSFARYLKMNGLGEASLFYQADGIVAHHGAVARCDMAVDDRSTLFVCGTGMATGDEEAYIQNGIIPMLTGDEELFPAAATENHQIHYATAGKGIFGLMMRAIRIRAVEGGSALKGYEGTLEPFFKGNPATRTVGLIWATSLGAPARDDAKKIKDILSPEAYREMETLAGWIMDRCVQSMATTTLATIAKMGRAPSGRGHIIFFEGSIANDAFAHPRLKAEIKRLTEKTGIYLSRGLEQPLLPEMDISYRPVLAGEGISPDDMAKVDLTALGAASMAMAENLRGIA